MRSVEGWESGRGQRRWRVSTKEPQLPTRFNFRPYPPGPSRTAARASTSISARPLRSPVASLPVCMGAIGPRLNLSRGCTDWASADCPLGSGAGGFERWNTWTQQAHRGNTADTPVCRFCYESITCQKLSWAICAFKASVVDRSSPTCGTKKQPVEWYETGSHTHHTLDLHDSLRPPKIAAD